MLQKGVDLENLKNRSPEKKMIAPPDPKPLWTSGSGVTHLNHRTTTVPTMPGWIAQWYENVPAVWNIMENCPPGATIPEFHPLASDVDVCAIESVFIQVTVSPAETFRASGL
jgi:hypothetical protein